MFRKVSQVTIAAVLLTLTIAHLSAQAQTSGTWVLTGQMANSEENATATLLQNGKVLVAGGDLGGIGVGIKKAQVYDPASNIWTAVGNMSAVRYGHSGTLLPNGKVLIAGGGNATYPNFHVLKSAELYDPVTRTFTLTGAMSAGHYGHTATLLPNGKVLVTGGMTVYWLQIRRGACTNVAELYDPASGLWSSAGTMSVVRCGHAATLVGNGKVLVSGAGTSEIYDPVSNSWASSGNMNVVRGGFSTVLLGNGKVLAAGPDTTAEIYDPATATWAATGSQLFSHGSLSMVVLPTTGKVLLAGNNSNGSCELYDPASGSWGATGSLNHPMRNNFPITLLSNGKALIVGGYYDWWSGEIYTP